MRRSEDAVAALICERTGRGPGDLDVHRAAAALVAVSTACRGTGWSESGRWNSSRSTTGSPCCRPRA